PLRRWRCCFAASDSWRRTRAFACDAFCLLPVTHHCWTSVSQFSMGCSSLGDRLSVDLSCALATLAAGADVATGVSGTGSSFSGLTARFVLAQVPSLQINTHVRRREGD